MGLEQGSRLKKAGYRRIAMAVEPAQNRHQNGIYYAAYLFSQLRLPARQRIPIFAPGGPWNKRSFQRWLEQHRPDVLCIHADMAETIFLWLANMTVRLRPM